MNRVQLVALYDQDQRKDVEYPDMRREVTPNIVRHVNTAGSGEGAIIYSRLDESNVEDSIREQVAYFERIGQNFEWKVYDHDTPLDLKERLAAHGFEVEEADAIMVLDLEKAPETLLQPVSHTVRRITDPKKIGDVLTVEEQVWAKHDADLGRYLAGALINHPQRMSIYVAYIDEKPVSAGWIYFPAQSQFASLWGGSTLVDYRGRGLYTALLGVRAQEAKGRQVRYLTVDASPMSRPILEKSGFEVIAYSYACKWKRRAQEGQTSTSFNP